MANIVLAVAELLKPELQVPSSEYNGTEYKYWKLVFRPAQYLPDAFIVAAIVVYVALYFVGAYANARLARAWHRAHRSLYVENFARPGLEDPISDGDSTFLVHSTGRRNVTRLHTVFYTRPRHEMLQQIINFGWGLINLDYKQEDVVELEFIVPQTFGGSSGWVWAIIKKDYMEKARRERWDLTFTKSTESPILSKSMILMSESADVSETLFKTNAIKNIVAIITSPEVEPFFRSLIISDQPESRPTRRTDTSYKERRVMLSLIIPPSAKADLTVPLVEALIEAIDSIASNAPALRPETKTKLKQRRDEIEADMRKEEEKEEKEAAEDSKRNERKSKKEEMIAAMSAADQKKQLEKDQKRAMRKAQGKIVKKG